MAAVIEPATFDQADRRVDDRDKGLAAGRPAQTAAGAQPLDLLGAVAALATARDRLRAQQAAADIGVERVAFDAEPLGGLAGRQVH